AAVGAPTTGAGGGETGAGAGGATVAEAHAASAHAKSPEMASRFTRTSVGIAVRLCGGTVVLPVAPKDVDEVRNHGHVECERDQLWSADAASQLVDFPRDERARRDDDEILRPATFEPQPDAFYTIQHRIGERDDGQLAKAGIADPAGRGEQAADEPGLRRE